MKWKRRALEWKEGRDERRGKVFHSAPLFSPLQAMRPSNCPSVCLSQSCTELKRYWTVLWPRNRFELQHSRLLTPHQTARQTSNGLIFSRRQIQRGCKRSWHLGFWWLFTMLYKYYKSSAVAEMGDRARAKWAEKWDGVCCAHFRRKAGPASNTMSPAPTYTSIRSDILIHPTVWPQYANVTRQTDRQRPDSTGRTFLQTVAQNYLITYIC